MKPKPKCFNDINFDVVQPQNSRFCNIYFKGFRLIRYEEKWEKIEKKLCKVMQSHSNIYWKPVLKWSLRIVCVCERERERKREREREIKVCLCDSWSLLVFCHFFLILLCWLWNRVQIQQHKNKVRFSDPLRDGGGFRWLRIISDGFR